MRFSKRPPSREGGRSLCEHDRWELKHLTRAPPGEHAREHLAGAALARLLARGFVHEEVVESLLRWGERIPGGGRARYAGQYRAQEIGHLIGPLQLGRGPGAPPSP